MDQSDDIRSTTGVLEDIVKILSLEHTTSKGTEKRRLVVIDRGKNLCQCQVIKVLCSSILDVAFPSKYLVSA